MNIYVNTHLFLMCNQLETITGDSKIYSYLKSFWQFFQNVPHLSPCDSCYGLQRADKRIKV